MGASAAKPGGSSLAYGLCLILTKSFDKEDIMILVAIGNRIGINIEAAKRILDKFS